MMTPEEIAISALAGLNSSKADNEVDQITELAYSKPTAKLNGKQKALLWPAHAKPRNVHHVARRKDYVNHSYNDFSCVPPEADFEPPVSIVVMGFSEKLHDILSKEEHKKFITWLPHGRSFKIFVPKLFESVCCMKYFGHKRYSSFLRHLNNYGFKQITTGPDRNSYYHECFLRGMPHLCKYMPSAKDARRKTSDPENEPDFYEISRHYPIPPDNHANVYAESSLETRTTLDQGSRQISVPDGPRPVVQLDNWGESLIQSLLLAHREKEMQAEKIISLLNAKRASEVHWFEQPLAKRLATASSLDRLAQSVHASLVSTSLLPVYPLIRGGAPSNTSVETDLVSVLRSAQQQQPSQSLILPEQLQILNPASFRDRSSISVADYLRLHKSV